MKPMVYTKENVLALLDDRKFNSRRLGGLKEINTDPDSWQYLGIVDGQAQFRHISGPITIAKPKYKVGDEVYVAEGYQIQRANYKTHRKTGIYLADGKQFDITLTDREFDLWMARKNPFSKTSGRFIYKSLARIFFEITEVRVEYLHVITLKDIRAEGITTEQAYECNRWKPCYGDPDSGGYPDYVAAFEGLWNSVHGAKAWDLNPYVFVYKWDKIRKNRASNSSN